MTEVTYTDILLMGKKVIDAEFTEIPDKHDRTRVAPEDGRVIGTGQESRTVPEVPDDTSAL